MHGFNIALVEDFQVQMGSDDFRFGDANHENVVGVLEARLVRRQSPTLSQRVVPTIGVFCNNFHLFVLLFFFHIHFFDDVVWFCSIRGRRFLKKIFSLLWRYFSRWTLWRNICRNCCIYWYNYGKFCVMRNLKSRLRTAKVLFEFYFSCILKKVMSCIEFLDYRLFGIDIL